MEPIDKIKAEMQARVDELRPYVEEYAQIEQLLSIMDSVKGKAVAYAEEAVPAFKQEKPKRKTTQRRAKRRVSRGDGAKTRVGLIKKYLRENGTSKLSATREYDGRTCFTYGSLMNAMNNEMYGRLTWNRAPGEVLPKLEELGVLVLKHQTVGKRIRKYYAIGEVT